ncbi:Type I restriction enzyme EcoprrI M protein [Staphylococcus aureus]|uniref:type I restriction-modification system subunit M n=1 Tax=Staphylococcus aureus TaxID=1280 RepID=UPI000E01834B|nr:type I restriction-modification system subunit M [Staphylococcus aureus]SUJ45894.1 Type I restriction enzyme EcoprrI M protein [Staphylococcus aureus]
MSITEKQRQQQAELHKKLWSIANDLRGNMDASEFRNYILGLIFYRFLSEKAEQEYADALSGEDITYQEAWADEEYREDLKAELIDQVGYFIEPQDLFSAMIREIETQVYRYFGQERNNTTYNLARMNMLLHDVRYENFDIRNDDTLENPAFLGTTFDAVIANPPYSAKWTADSKFENDERFSGYGKLAPKSKADFAFIQHMVHYLDDEGTMAVVLPHGVLFRGAAEGVIRRYLIEEKNYLEAVIGLPANIFYGTSIPTCILVFKKCRQQDDNVLFIDASNDFEKGKNQNHLSDAQVERIINTYKRKETIDKYSYSATLQEITDNDYNLNIPRYVDTFEEEAPIDLDQVQQDLKNIDKEIAEIEQEINAYLKELGVLKDE